EMPGVVVAAERVRAAPEAVCCLAERFEAISATKHRVPAAWPGLRCFRGGYRHARRPSGRSRGIPCYAFTVACTVQICNPPERPVHTGGLYGWVYTNRPEGPDARDRAARAAAPSNRQPLQAADPGRRDQVRGPAP